MKKLVLLSSLILASTGAFAETAKSDATPAAPTKAASHDAAKTTHWQHDRPSVQTCTHSPSRYISQVAYIR